MTFPTWMDAAVRIFGIAGNIALLYYVFVFLLDRSVDKALTRREPQHPRVTVIDWEEAGVLLPSKARTRRER